MRAKVLFKFHQPVPLILRTTPRPLARRCPQTDLVEEADSSVNDKILVPWAAFALSLWRLRAYIMLKGDPNDPNYCIDFMGFAGGNSRRTRD